MTRRKKAELEDPSPKRYWLFGNADGRPTGGAIDFLTMVDDLERAKGYASVHLQPGYHDPLDWCHIWDSVEWKIVFELSSDRRRRTSGKALDG